METKNNTHHGEVDVGGVELHVDLLVDEGLGVGVEVLADLGLRHLDAVGFVFFFRRKKGDF